MYNEFFGFNDKPFSLSPDPSFLYLSDNHKKAKAMLEYGLMSHAGFTVITGDIGAGKTTLINYELSLLDDDVIVGVVNNTHESFGDLMTWVLAAFDLEGSGLDNTQKLRRFSDYVLDRHEQGKRILLVIDEAQNLSERTLEELRLLSNINISSDIFLQLILVGQPELMEKLNSPRLVQFAQRIGVDFNLRPMNYKDTGNYIYHRLAEVGCTEEIFTEDAIAAIYCFSEGVPRRINTLCDMSLVYAFADENRAINAAMVMDVIKDRNAAAVIRPTATDNAEIRQVAAWLENYLKKNLESMSTVNPLK